MTRQARCGYEEARRRAAIAVKYLEVAEVAASESVPQSRNVAAGNAVLAAIAAADAICCVRLGRHHRGENHSDAVALLRETRPEGPDLVGSLSTVLAVKDLAHYLPATINDSRLTTIIRAATKLVEAATKVVSVG